MLLAGCAIASVGKVFLLFLLAVVVLPVVVQRVIAGS